MSSAALAAAPGAATAPAALVPSFNLHVIETRRPQGGTQQVVTDEVSFVPPAPRHPGGSRIVDHLVGGRLVGSHIQVYPATARERAAAQSLHDAIVGSGLLQRLEPSPDLRRPAAGMTRIFVDRRSRFIEFETGRAPAEAQAVLDALETYRRMAAS